MPVIFRQESKGRNVFFGQNQAMAGHNRRNVFENNEIPRFEDDPVRWLLVQIQSARQRLVGSSLHHIEGIHSEVFPNP